MKIKSNKGPSTDPIGSPLKTSSQDGMESRITSVWCLPVKNEAKLPSLILASRHTLIICITNANVVYDQMPW